MYIGNWLIALCLISPVVSLLCDAADPRHPDPEGDEADEDRTAGEHCVSTAWDAGAWGQCMRFMYQPWVNLVQRYSTNFIFLTFLLLLR